MPKSLFRRALPLLVLSGVFSGAASAAAQGLTSGIPGALVFERILLKINGDLITQTDLEQAQINVLRTRPVPPQTDAELQRVLQEITPDVIVNAVDQMLLVQRGREMGYALDDEQFEEILEGIKEENSMTDEQLVVALEQEQGMNLAQLRGVMEEQMLAGQVQQDQVLRRVSMTDTEALEYYETHPEEYTEPATVLLREILVTVPVEAGALNVARENQAQSLAESALARARGGEAFEAVVSELSDAASRANGGLIGPIALADLAATVRSRIEELEVGEIGEIERTPGGYQILKLESSTAAAPAPFEEVREQIVDNVFNERRLQALNRYLATLRSEAIIEWKDEGLQRLYEERQASQQNPTPGL
jgi:peptidyl-prolyl cis-trans isomerase SurA